jgi:DNA-binding winged helix-turn-helix (wHTH) protein/TolA-binding protein
VLKQKRVYRFGAFQLEPEEFALTRSGKPVQLSGKAFQILVFLVENHGHLILKEKIIRHIWPDSHVSDGSLDVNLNTIKKALKENYIENVPRRGYRFIAPVAEFIEEEEPQAHKKTRKQNAKWIGATLLLITLPLALYFAFHSKNRRAPLPARLGTVLYEKALEYELAGDDEQALTALDQTLSADPSYGEACVRAAYVSYELEDKPKATAYLKRCGGMPPEGSSLRLKAQALNEFLADNSNQSMELYQLLVDRYPTDPDAQYRFAEVATDLDRVQEADKAVAKCLKIDPLNPFCHFQKMYVRLKQNRFNDVIEDYHSLPDELRAYPWFDEPLGVAFMGIDQTGQAREAFERLTRAQRTMHGTSHFTVGKEWLADVLLYEGRIKDATRRIQQIMETRDNASSAGSYLVYLGRIYALIGNRQQAIGFASQVSTSPGDAGDITSAAVVMASVGDAEGAARLLKLRSSKTTAPLSPAHDHLIRGLAAAAKGSYPDAIEEIKLAHDLHPWDEEASYWLGMTYFRSGDYKSALEMFESLQALKGTILLDDAPLLVALTSERIAECYERLGALDAAKPYYSEVARIWASADGSLISSIQVIGHKSR